MKWTLTTNQMLRRVLFYLAIVWCGIALAKQPLIADFPMPSRSELMEGYNDTDSLLRRLSASPLHQIEGLWHFPADGGRVVIERETSLPGKVYNIIALQTSNHGIAPGTLLGRLRATAKPNVFEARLFTVLDDEAVTLSNPKPFTLQLDEERALLTFTPIRKGWKFDVLKMLPYWLRRPLSHVDETPTNQQGLQRLYPRPEMPSEPIYL